MSERLGDNVAELMSIVEEVRRAGARIEAGEVHVANVDPSLLVVDTVNAAYLVESLRDSTPCLVTRFSETPPRLDYDGPQLPQAHIVRKPGNPDMVITIGNRMNILGLRRVGQTFDPDSIYTTGPVVAITIL